MERRTVLLLLGASALSACAGGAATTARLGPDGRPLPQVYPITPADAGKIQLRMLDSVNSLRRARGAPPLALSAELNAAAATHSRDMSVQNRPWHFGSDGSSPVERVRRVGYPGTMLGELISETYETELETLAAWMEDADHRAILLDPAGRHLGFNFFQEQNGKIWWTLITGT